MHLELCMGHPTQVRDCFLLCLGGINFLLHLRNFLLHWNCLPEEIQAESKKQEEKNNKSSTLYTGDAGNYFILIIHLAVFLMVFIVNKIQINIFILISFHSWDIGNNMRTDCLEPTELSIQMLLYLTSSRLQIRSQR